MKSSGIINNAVKVKDEPEDISLYESEDCASFQYIQFLQDNATQTIVKKEEIHDSQLEDEIEIEFESKDVKPTITSFVPQKLDYLFQNRTAIKNEPLDMVKKEYFDDNVQKSKKKPTLKSIIQDEKSKKPKACSKKSGRKSKNKEHIETTAQDQIAHSCGICGKKFLQKHKLEIHTDVVHNGQKLRIAHTCDSCGKTFTHNVHKGITHPCDLCEKVFRQKASLKVHKDAVHEGIAYQCDRCEKSFTRKGKLKLHVNEVHNGKK
ncbi:zinc finger protein draculin-like [Trichogramma pretiosum]|uniref:zinc finger protein draculin-like n=1 Tax=Trichogramma pretiosum TaxID=7493 RepID=UPI0006C94805|nr:zinc finger protein draculin-like [Trichogramma pretiosum]